MAYNFLELVNEINRRLNEVELTTTTFTTATGFYQTAKDAVNSSIRHINHEEFSWPWNHREEEEVLSAGIARYSYPEDAKLINMDSFRIKRNERITSTARVNGAISSTTALVVDTNVGTITAGMTVTGEGIVGTVTVSSLSDQNNLVLSTQQTLSDNVALTFTKGLGVETKKLKAMDYQEYLDNHVDHEYNTNNSIRTVPRNIIRTPSQEFIFYPCPDKAYEVVYEYYQNPVSLSLSSDVPTIPKEFQHVIVDGAMFYAYQFRGDNQSAQISQQKFEQGIKYMRSLYINRYDYLRSSMIVKASGVNNVLRVS